MAGRLLIRLLTNVDYYVQRLDGGPCLVHQVDHCFDDDNYCRDDL